MNSFKFTKQDIEKISNALGAEFKEYQNHFRLEVKNEERKLSLFIEIYPELEMGKNKGSLISVYGPITHLQLHFCTGYVISDLLEEVTFISEFDGKVSGLTIEKEGGCSLYANVDRSILSGDFTKLGPEVMLSSIALSLAEDILKENQNEKTKD
ncbi:MAG: hypothetical protein NUV92_09585 [Ignavibacteria bacterium]|jgi:hypothetical protein|nr:hypothetical protein [Ignavibacteria bacterium]MDH7528180.1 hypothetical protein [Ignavibacteria bacterium]